MRNQCINLVNLCLFVLIGATALRVTSTPISAANDYPIVLVHGFTGWGRDELLGYKYWGGLDDMERNFNNHGYETYTATVGPVSSNWDRACELYAYILGGTVDYGQAHADLHGHDRFGRTFDGLYPEWGSLDADGQIRKIHLLAHSQGGQTSRVLAHLLKQGAPEEMAVSGSDTSSLFYGGKSWVRGVMTLATPHDGTTLASNIYELVPFAQDLIAGFVALAGISSQSFVYDFKLDHFGLRRNAGESLSSYSHRVFNSALFTNAKDISAWDLSPEGAEELNQRFSAQSDIYYFSWATETTYPGWITGYEYPEVLTLPLFYASAILMGNYTQSGPVPIDSSWFKNDGIVNTVSMDGPTNGSGDRIVNYNGNPQPGKWNYMGVLWSWDHADVIGHGTLGNLGWFRDQAALLQSLPE